MTLASRTASSRWPLWALVLGVLAMMLLPLGMLAMLLTMADYRAVVASDAAGLTLAQAAHIGLPLGLWLLALGAGWWTLRAMIIVPLRHLQRLVEASGHDIDHGEFGSCELATLAESIIALAATVAVHNAELDAALAEQRRLTREVHHRVKNSMQIVASLVALPPRGMSTDTIIATYAAMQARVSALTTVHRWIHHERGVNLVNLHALVADLAGALETSLAAPGHHLAIISQSGSTAFDIGADTAIPLAFLITEFASIAVQASEPGTVVLGLEASRAGDTVTLAVSTGAFMAADLLADGDHAASARIVRGMVRQLRSRLYHDDATGRYSISFVDPSIASG